MARVPKSYLRQLLIATSDRLPSHPAKKVGEPQLSVALQPFLLDIVQLYVWMSCSTSDKQPCRASKSGGWGLQLSTTRRDGTWCVYLLVQSVYFGKDVFYMKMDDAMTAPAEVVLSALHRAAIAAIVWSCLETGVMLLAGFTFSYCWQLNTHQLSSTLSHVHPHYNCYHSSPSPPL